jgi:uncharacterized membrane-anchored protein
MIGIIAFHAVMLALGLAVATRGASPQFVSGLLGYLHKSIGITTPSTTQVWMVALIWIASVVFMVDGFLFLLLFISRVSRP